MARLNPDIAMIDDGQEQPRRVIGPSNDTSKITEAEMQAASIAAARELAMVPYAELPADVKKSMTATEKREYVTAQREEAARLDREEATYSDPLQNPEQRPDAQTLGDNNYIVYYSWVGGTKTGNWRPTRVPRNEDNLATYGGRQVGGPTMASQTGNISDANTLVVQPTPIRNNDGQITGWEVDGTNAIDLIGTDGTVSGTGGTSGTGSTGGTGVPGFTGAGTGTGTGTGTGKGTNTGSGVGTGAGLTFTASDGRTFTDQQAYVAYQSNLANQKAERKSAYDLLYNEFDKYGLSSLVTPLKDLITSGVSPSEFTIKLRDTDAYKNRFAANQARIKNGLRALSEAEYIRNEDAYQEVMRRRGLPASYYEQTVDPVTGITKQKGFEALLAGDVSSTELEDRIVTAQDRVINANPEIAAQLKQFYPGISNGDILAYTLDPANAINQIKRKITAAEIGAAAGTYGLGTTVGRAEQLAGAGVTEATAQQGFKTIAQVGPRAGVLAQYYKQDPYTQETAEREFFGLTGAREAEMQRKKLTSLEQAAFSGSAGAGAIARDRAGVL
jgi:hypothetical protein